MNRPDRISLKHRQELVEGSGVHPEIVVRNVRSLDDPVEIDNLLGRKSKRWKHWQHGPGWAVSGIEPATGEPTFLGCQFKPDIAPQEIKDGVAQFKADGTPKLRKYFSALGYEAQPLFLDAPLELVPDWKTIIDDVTISLLIVEGPKKAAAGLTLGYASVSLPGVANGQKKGELNPRLNQFCRVGRTVYIAFDFELDNPNVAREIDRLGRLLSVTGCVVKVVLFPEDAHKLNDCLVKHGVERTQEIISGAMTFERWRSEFYVPVMEAQSNSHKEQQSEDEAKRSAAAWMAETAIADAHLKFFQNQLSKEFYVSLPAKLADPGGPWLVSALHGTELENYLRLCFRQEHKKSAPMEAPKTAIADLAASLMYGELPYDVYPMGRRSIRIGNDIYIDLADEGGHYIHVCSEGWEVCLKNDDCPVRFIGGSQMGALPIPDRGGASLDAFDDWLPAKSLERAVALAWILSTYLGKPYWLLLIVGAPGSGKTNLAKILLMVADPKPEARALRTRPREARDLATAAANHHVAALDNVTSLGGELSDVLCVMLTGGSAAERRMATNFVEACAMLCNPVMMTAVSSPITAPDLSSRTLGLELPSRQENEDLEPYFQRFERRLPQTLAAIFDAVSYGLSREQEISTVGLPR